MLATSLKVHTAAHLQEISSLCLERGASIYPKPRDVNVLMATFELCCWRCLGEIARRSDALPMRRELPRGWPSTVVVGGTKVRIRNRRRGGVQGACLESLSGRTCGCGCGCCEARAGWGWVDGPKVPAPKRHMSNTDGFVLPVSPERQPVFITSSCRSRVVTSVAASRTNPWAFRPVGDPMSISAQRMSPRTKYAEGTSRERRRSSLLLQGMYTFHSSRNGEMIPRTTNPIAHNTTRPHLC